MSNDEFENDFISEGVNNIDDADGSYYENIIRDEYEQPHEYWQEVGQERNKKFFDEIEEQQKKEIEGKSKQVKTPYNQYKKVIPNYEYAKPMSKLEQMKNGPVQHKENKINIQIINKTCDSNLINVDEKEVDDINKKYAKDFFELLCDKYDFKKAEAFHKKNHVRIDIDFFSKLFLDKINDLIVPERNFRDAEHLFCETFQKTYIPSLKIAPFYDKINKIQYEHINQIKNDVESLLKEVNFDQADKIIDKAPSFTKCFQEEYDKYITEEYKPLKRKYKQYKKWLNEIWAVLNSSNNITLIIENLNRLFLEIDFVEIYNQKSTENTLTLKIQQKINELCEEGKLKLKKDNTFCDPTRRQCARCGVEIPKKRLNSVPGTSYCVRCQTAAENPVISNKAYVSAYVENQRLNEEKYDQGYSVNKIEIKFPNTTDEVESFRSFQDLIEKLSTKKEIPFNIIVEFLNKCRHNNEAYPISIDKFNEEAKLRIVEKTGFKKTFTQIDDNDFKDKYQKTAFILGLIQATKELVYKPIDVPPPTKDESRFLFHISDFYSRQFNILQEQLQQEIDAAYALDQNAKLEEAILAERDRVFANLAHSIKNLISSVQSPLRNIAADADLDKTKKRRIDHALKGLKLIKEISFAIDHSYTGSIEDFREDACFESDGVKKLSSIILEALMNAAENMFDRNYFEKPSFNYFPKGDKERKNSAYKKCQQIAEKCDPDSVAVWLNKYLLDFKLDVDDAAEFAFKNTKNSAMKFLVMAQEIMINALKYSSYVPREERFLNVSLKTSGDNIVFQVKNSMQPSNREKTTGNGRVVIERFARLLGTEPDITKSEEKKSYDLKIAFENFWSRLSNVNEYPINETPVELRKVSERANEYKVEEDSK